MKALKQVLLALTLLAGSFTPGAYAASNAAPLTLQDIMAKAKRSVDAEAPGMQGLAECRQPGYACRNSGECCGASSCRSGVCSDSGNSCRGPGAACSNSGQCCGASSCRGGYCSDTGNSCRPSGAQCSNSGQCCGASSCRGNFCS